jgi:hypothetical protein
MRIGEMPKIETIVMPSGRRGARCAQRVFCGKRIRSVPLKNHDITFV